MDIDLLLAKIESLKDIVSEHFETDLSWARVMARQYKKSTWHRTKGGVNFSQNKTINMAK